MNFFRKTWSFTTIELFLGSFSIVLFFGLIFSNSSIIFPHIETYMFLGENGLKGGANLDLSIFENMFNPNLEGRTDRPRYYNWFFWIINSTFRYHYFKNIFPHASISLSWIFTAIILPVYLFKYAYHLSKNYVLSFLTVSLLFSTQGFLSVHTMYFHAAKPFALVGTLISMYYTTMLRDKVLNNTTYFSSYIKLILTIVLSLFWDENYYVYFLSIPVIFPEVFYKKKPAALIGAVVLFSFLTFLIFTNWIVPLKMKELFNYDFNFWNYAFSSNEGIRNVKLGNIVYNASSLLSTHLVPIISPASYEWRSPFFGHGAMLSILSSLLALPLILKRKLFKEYGKFLILVIIYIFFISMIVTRRDGVLFNGAFYWGSSFSLFFVLLYFSFFNALGSQKLYVRILRITLFLSFCFAGHSSNYSASIGHIKSFQLGPPWLFVSLPTTNAIKSIRNKEVAHVFSDTSSMKIVTKKMEGFPKNSYWLYFESLIQYYGGELPRNWKNDKDYLRIINK